MAASAAMAGSQVLLQAAAEAACSELGAPPATPARLQLRVPVAEGAASLTGPMAPETTAVVEAGRLDLRMVNSGARAAVEMPGKMAMPAGQQQPV